jgi:hypothetical protein
VEAFRETLRHLIKFKGNSPSREEKSAEEKRGTDRKHSKSGKIVGGIGRKIQGNLSGISLKNMSQMENTNDSTVDSNEKIEIR